MNWCIFIIDVTLTKWKCDLAKEKDQYKKQYVNLLKKFICQENFLLLIQYKQKEFT